MTASRMLAAVVVASTLGACSRSGPAPDPVSAPARTPDVDRTEALRTFERDVRARLDFAHAPSSETTLGPDPWALAPLYGGRWVGVLRGRSQVVLLDANTKEIDRIPGPRSPMAVATSPSGDAWVASGLGHTIEHVVVRGDKLAEDRTFDVPDARGFRELEWRGDKLFALDPVAGRVAVLDAKEGRVLSQLRACESAVHMKVTSKGVAVACLFDHAIILSPFDGGEPTTLAKHDGPIWGFDAREAKDGSLVVAAGGVEDHALDRTEGSFGYIDSFLFVYRGGKRTQTINLSEHGVVTPKAVVMRDDDTATVAGYGADQLARVDLASGKVETSRAVPGIRELASPERGGWVAADPLLDAWVVVDASGATRVVPVDDTGAPARSTSSKLGEALIFTTLMAPWNKSEGRLSRFTCETCHFEGFGDGRVHWTGRSDHAGAKIMASTKPLFGLAANKPHFSRALDPDLATVAMNEFRVANANSGHDPWFSIDAPWLGVPTQSPDDLRRAFMTFLVDFTHRPNPLAAGKKELDAVERKGAEVFRDKCASCHAPRLAADDPKSEVAFAEWPAAILSDAAPIVWGKAEYAMTGVVPYVNEKGARVPSLRRLYAKRPYFTNGSARSLDEVLSKVRLSPFAHASPSGTPLPADDQASLRAFLSLL